MSTRKLPLLERYVRILEAASADLATASAELNQAAFQLEAARADNDADPEALRRAATAAHERLAYVLGLALQASAAAERYNTVASLLEAP